MSDAEILGRGYRPYTGDRRGVSGAVRSVWWHSLRSIMGIGRPARSKILPVFSSVIAYLPAVVFVGLAALLPEDLVIDSVLGTYADYYGFVISAIVLFVALVSPEALQRDRSSGMLALYLASPLDRNTYVLAKALTVATVLSIVTIGPLLLMLVGLTFEGAGPDSVQDFLTLLGRILAGGAVVTGVFTSVSMGVTALTPRRSFASVGIILLLLVGAFTAGVLVESGASEAVRLISLLELPLELTHRIFGQPGESPTVSTAALVAASVAWTVAGGLIVWRRYQTLSVAR